MRIFIDTTKFSSLQNSVGVKIKIWKLLTFIISVVGGGVVAVIGCTADCILVASGFTLTIEWSRILFNCHTGPHYFIVIIVCVVHFFHATGLMIRENLFSAFAFWIQAQIDWACSWIGDFNTSKVSSDAFNLIVVLNWVSQKAKSNFKTNCKMTFILTHNFLCEVAFFLPNEGYVVFPRKP